MQNYQLVSIILLALILTVQNLPSDICDGTETVQFIPHPENCSQFIICLMGVGTVVDCNVNQIFNPIHGRCEPGNPVTCELFTSSIAPTSTSLTQTETEPQTTTESLEPTDTTTVSTDSTTDQQLTTNYEPPSTTTSHETEIQTTTNPEFTEDSTIQESTSTTSILRTTTSASAPIHRCPPGGNGIIPNYANCSRYFECINGIRYVRFCPFGLLFDSVTLDCTSPDVAVCAGSKKKIDFNI